MQLVSLIRALEVVAVRTIISTLRSELVCDTHVDCRRQDSLAVLAVIRTQRPAYKADLDDDVIFNVPGWRPRRESRPTLPSAAPSVPEAVVDSALRLLLMTRHKELEWELRGLCYLIWRANPKAKVELGNIVQRLIPSHHAELMTPPVEDFVKHWQATVVPSGYGSEGRTSDYDTDSWWVSDRSSALT
jgi:hypothetical protein